MERKVVFTSGYSSSISPTKDFGIKEFPPAYPPLLKDTLENFCCTQAFLQKKGLKHIVLLAHEASFKEAPLVSIFFASLEYDIKDHENRPSFRLSGNLFVRPENRIQNLSWTILPISYGEEEKWQNFCKESSSLEQAYEILKSRPEFHLYQKSLQDITHYKKQALVYKKFLFFLFFVGILLFGLLYWQENKINQLQQEKQHFLVEKNNEQESRERLKIYQKKLEKFYDDIVTTIPDRLWENTIGKENRERLNRFNIKEAQEIEFTKDANPENNPFTAKAFLKAILLYKKDLQTEIDKIKDQTNTK